ncbi:Zinc finger, RING-CH-type [Kalmanozyma brasiliensis GHG001]|uniref:RING-CH-type domain-containing protein n=1 Tax=Kalmanozyma brasiliensis (strain GHG001) TaxID=1365824 RepID=V5EU29_KALBG|nr:Zinc finger, RING-CH-type [Kalmanozyma brasiliensis GHG001]EST06603.1 Zinc finger, RING-CH-type [Kalmanozyma brasiliensis GHG001]
MDVEGINVIEERHEEEEVEFIQGALPSIWHNTQNVLRDLGYQRAAEEHDDHDDDDDDDQSGQQEGLRHRRAGTQEKEANAFTSATSDPTHSTHDDEAEEKVCRMCFSSEDELGEDGMSLGRLIAPCHCDGSMRYVHDTCLDQWRRKSAATEAARVCGQCHARYRFKRTPYSNLVAFAQASQMLRILFCVLIVFLASFLFGVLALLTLKTIATLKATPLAFVRDAALRPVQLDNRPWNITLHQDEAVADVWMPADLLQRSRGGLVPHIDSDVYERADLEVFSRIRSQELRNPTYWKKIRKPLSTFRANYTDTMIIRAKLRSGEDVSEELERLSLGLPLFPLDAWYNEARPARSQNSTAASANGTGSIPLTGLHIPSSLPPTLRERLVGTDFKFGFQLPFLSPKTKDDDDRKHSDEVDIWQRQNMTIKFVYEESPADVFPDPSEHFLVRRLPEWLGIARFVPYGVALAMIDRFYFVISVFQPWWSSIARSALQLALLLLESHRELIWCASKAVVAGLIAYIDVEYEPVRWNPKNAVVIGPARTRRRRAAAVARELVVSSADSVFGPLWLNWWGGYSLAVYMGPGQWMTTERVEMTQLAAIFAPAFTLLIDVAMSGLGSFSSRAARFQKSHTTKWTNADWVHNEYSASEGYRRMIATLLGDDTASQASLYDLWLETSRSKLLPGRTRPLQMALMSRLDTWKTVMLLGCLVTTTLALLVATKLAWDTTISHFARQAWRSVVGIYQLIIHSGESFRQMWRQTRDSSLFIARYAAARVKAVAGQVVRSVKRLVPGNRDVSGDELASQSATAYQTAATPDETAVPPEAAQPEAIPEPLLNDPFLQGGNSMGIFGAILGHVASIYGCLHAFVFTMRFILVYLPFEPFMIIFTLLQKLIQVDVANTEVLDREDRLG